jgi:hypothetical protein
LEAGEGGEKHPLHGTEIGVPVTLGPARPTFPTRVEDTDYMYRQLRLRNGEGRLGTFVIPGVGVFQRVGPGGRKWNRTLKRMQTTNSDTVRMVYLFMPEARLRTRFQMRAAMEKVIALRFNRIFSEEFQKEILAKVGR